MDLNSTSWPAELSRDPLVRYGQFRDSPWLFLKFATFTHDEVDTETPVKPFPAHLNYLYFLVLMFIRNKLLAIPKSRRLTVSWTFIALAVHDSIFNKGRSWAFVSKKEEDSKELVQRAEFIYNNIPPEMIAPDLLPKLVGGGMKNSPPILEFEFGRINSKIQGFPQGGNQLRQRGFSGILEDECAFWEEAEAAYASAKPTIDGGGRMVMVSTRYPGFFKKVVYDQLDRKDLNFAEVAPAPVRSPMEGIDVWVNPRNRFTVIDLSHRANPAKRSPEFEKMLRETLPVNVYRMEYGKSWDTFEGKPVYEDFNEHLHTVKVEPRIHQNLPLLLGWDSSGLTPAVVIGQLQEDRLVIVREIVGIGMGATRFIPHVIEQLRLFYPQVTDLEQQTVSFFDPAGFKKNEITEETYLQALIKNGFKQIRPGPQGWNKRRDSVTEWLVGLAGGQPKFIVYEQGCPILTAGLKGGYRYPDKVIDTEPDQLRPIKDIHSHPNDGLQYLCGGLKTFRLTSYTLSVPTPQYGFQKHTDKVASAGKSYGR